jgi:hypothetical protein
MAHKERGCPIQRIHAPYLYINRVFLAEIQVVLVPAYHLRRKHDYCGREFLEWGGRGSRIMEEILAYSADILCLQEASVGPLIGCGCVSRRVGG